jgi:hypothetical protein
MAARTEIVPEGRIAVHDAAREACLTYRQVNYLVVRDIIKIDHKPTRSGDYGWLTPQQLEWLIRVGRVMNDARKMTTGMKLSVVHEMWRMMEENPHYDEMEFRSGSMRSVV